MSAIRKTTMKKKTDKKELAKILPGTLAGVINHAILKGTDLEKLEKLLSLQERWEANEARKAFNADMVLAQGKMPSVAKNLKNPQTRSKYASLDEIVTAAKSVYTDFGFSISFNEGVTEKPEHVRICAEVLHRAGHKEGYHLDVPLDGMGIKGNANMTRIHAKASSTSYGRRYLMCMIWNIATGDDDDGNSATSPAKSTFTVSENGEVNKSGEVVM